jgi:hypothetical protein
MADRVKVQGSVEQCLRKLGEYARQYGVKYMATFGTSRHTYSIGTGATRIPIHFMWRFEYNEFDNSS